MGFIHLHNHTEYSLLDGLCRVRELVEQSIKFGMNSVAITDHGNLFGAVRFYKMATAMGLKPIIGMEAYIAPHSMTEKKAYRGAATNYHLTLLAENNDGWRNLMQISSDAYLLGFYYKPRIDKEYLSEHSNGIIALSGCLKGEIPQRLLNGDVEGAKRVAAEYVEIFGKNNFFIELMDHGIEEEHLVLPKLISIANEMGIPIVATNDTHYLLHEDSKYHNILLAMGTKKTIDDENRFQSSTNELYFKTPAEMEHLFSEFPDAIANTERIAERCVVKMEFGHYRFPHFYPPEGYPDLASYLRDEAEAGLERLYPRITQKLKDRLEHELDIIIDMGFAGYYAIVADFVKAARKRGIRVGPGRGSGPGSLVAHCIGITEVDPMKFDLIFERFLNPERKTMPDFDIDFPDNRRDEVIEYVKERYGKDSVSHIITFNRIKARTAVKDVGRTMGFPFALMNRLSQMIPSYGSIADALANSPELNDFIEKNNHPAGVSDKYSLTDIVQYAQKFELLPRQPGMHAAGIVIAPGRITDYIPLYLTSNDEITTQFEMDIVEEMGLLKMDFLGLRTLTVIEDTIDSIKNRTGEDIKIENVDIKDKKTFQLLSKGRTTGLFQFESDGMTRNLMKLKPDSINDLVAMNALYRPGPMKMIEVYIARKHGEEKVEYLHPDMEPILKETYGIIVYQEQVMLLARRFANYSLGEADILRKAMGKKDERIMSEQRDTFIERAVKRGYDEKLAREIFDLISEFAKYGFNKAHSVSYSLLAYQTAYLKAHYPLDYMAANLTSIIGRGEKIASLLKECKDMGIEILFPSVNKSFHNFTVEKDAIRFGLGAIKNLGQGGEIIVEERKGGGEFKNFYEFCERVIPLGINQKMLESLVAAGALDELGGTRRAMFEEIATVVRRGASHKKQSDLQLTFFDIGAMEKTYPSLPALPEWELSEYLSREKAALDLFLSGHPLTQFGDEIKGSGAIDIADVVNIAESRSVRIAGHIAELTRTRTKKKEAMAFGRIEDLTGSIKITFFPRVYENIRSLIKPDVLLIVDGKLDTSQPDPQINAENAVLLSKFRENNAHRMHIHLDTETIDDKALAHLQKTLKKHAGDKELIMHLQTPEKTFLMLARDYSVDCSKKLQEALVKELGERDVWIEWKHNSENVE